MPGPKNQSAIVVARLLSTEGFTDHLSGEIVKYALKQATQGQRQRFRRNKKMFSAMVKEKLTDADKLIMGKYFGCRLKMALDAGLRMGLTAFLNLPDEEREAFRLAIFDNHKIEDALK
jgi:hypothetical protein